MPIILCPRPTPSLPGNTISLAPGNPSRAGLPIIPPNDIPRIRGTRPTLPLRVSRAIGPIQRHRSALCQGTEGECQQSAKGEGDQSTEGETRHGSQEKIGKPGTPIMMPAHNQGGIDKGESGGETDPAPANHRSTKSSAETAGSPPLSTQRECNSAYKASVWSWVPRYQSAPGSSSNSASSNSTASQTMPTTEEDMAMRG